jgi:hypothetical protein
MAQHTQFDWPNCVVTPPALHASAHVDAALADGPRVAVRGRMKLIIACVVLASLPACVDDDLELDRVDQLASVYHRYTIWRQTTIPVCWEHDDPVNDHVLRARGLVRDAVEQTWERVSDVDFVGWGTCPDTAGYVPGIHIGVADNEPISNLGTHLDGEWRGMSLNFTFQNYKPVCASPDRFDGCVRRIAIEQFGHALGLANEASNPDSLCDVPDPRPTGTDSLGPYDPDSVMNPCNEALYTNGSPLSPGDIRAVQVLYGAPRGSITGRGGRCLGVDDVAETPDGTAVRARACNDDLRQRWMLYPESQAVFGSVGKALALDPAAPAGQDGALAMVRSWANTARYRWSMENAEIRGFAGQCLDVAGASTANGAKVWMYTCNGTVAQQWTLRTDGRIQSAVGNRCLEIKDASTASYARLQTWECSASRPHQVWGILAGGQLRGYGGKCVDVAHFSADPGATVNMYGCKANVEQNQRWSFTGRLRNGDGKCLDVHTGDPLTTDGTRVQGWTCYGTDPQRFTYYP